VEIRAEGEVDLAPYARAWEDDYGDAQRGRYVFDLAPGSYRLRIIHPEHATVERTVRVPKENARLELVLP
jgi:hypothetical protein